MKKSEKKHFKDVKNKRRLVNEKLKFSNNIKENGTTQLQHEFENRISTIMAERYNRVKYDSSSSSDSSSTSSNETEWKV